jgi:hypothetical protein
MPPVPEGGECEERRITETVIASTAPSASAAQGHLREQSKKGKRPRALDASLEAPDSHLSSEKMTPEAKVVHDLDNEIDPSGPSSRRRFVVSS